MHNKILDYAKDKNCLLCVTPDRGGSVYSPLYTPSWRNFNSNPATWTAAQTAMTDIDVSQDYTLEIEFVYEEYNESKLIFHYTNGYGLITIWQNASNYVVITTTLLKTDGSTTDYYLTQILPSRFNVNEKNAVKVSVSGTSINIFVNGNNLVSETGKVRTNTTNVATYPMNTNIDHVYSINITNDTTGKTVWQASYEDVHEVYEPINFFGNSKRWTTYQTAQEAADWTHNYTFQCTFKLNEVTNGQLLYSMPTYQMFGIYVYADRTIGFFTNLLKSDGSSINYIAKTITAQEGTAIWGQVNTIRIKISDVIIRMYLNDEQIYVSGTMNNLIRTTKDELTLEGPWSSLGSIYDCWIRDDTDDKIIWQAEHSGLYKEIVGGMSPNPTTINFDKNPYAFYDCQAVVQEALDPTHDYSFLIEADRVSERTENSLFYAGTDKLPFGVYYHADHTIKFFTNLLRNEGDPSGTYASLNFYTGTDWLLGRHAFEARIEGNAITTYVDGVQCATSNKFARTGTATVGLPNCNSGYVYKIQIRDLTENRLIWNYPSEAERVNLLYKYNMTTNDGFAPSSTNTNSYVKTSLDLRNKVSNYTLFVDFEPAVFTDESTEQHQELAGQGGALIGSGYPPICSIAYYKDASAYHHIQLAQQVNSKRAAANYKFYNALTGRHKLVGTVKVNGTSNTELSIYLDGDKVSSTTASGVPNGTADSNATNFNINGQLHNYGWNNYPGKVYNCLLFDRLLTDGEIKALS